MRFFTPIGDLLRKALVPLTLLVAVGGVYTAGLAHSFESEMDRYRKPAWGPLPVDEEVSSPSAPAEAAAGLPCRLGHEN